VYVGGIFPHVIDTDGTDYGSGSTGPYQFLCAFNAANGALIKSFKPQPDEQIFQIVVSDDGATIYVVGNFTSIAGSNRARIAAFEALSGPGDTRTAAALLRTNPNVSANDYVRSLVFDWTAGKVYVGGDFSSIGGSSRGCLARFSFSGTGAWSLDSDWQPSVTGGGVYYMLLKPDRTKIVVGGKFTAPNPSNMAYDTSTGSALRFDYTPTDSERGTGFTQGLATNAAGDTVYVGGGCSGGNSMVATDWNGSGTVDYLHYKVKWFYVVDGNVQAIGMGRLGSIEVVFAGHHGDNASSDPNIIAPLGTGHLTRHGLFVCNAKTGVIQDYGNPPSFTNPQDCSGNATGTPWKLWAIFQNPTTRNLYIGGDFTSLDNGCTNANNRRRFARFLATFG
jgi:hypothetical protein